MPRTPRAELRALGEPPGAAGGGRERCLCYVEVGRVGCCCGVWGGHGASDGLWVPQPAHSARPRGICSVGAFGSPRMLRPLCAGVLV